ncbi:hypothetical protein [Neorhodopirellula pilleata]|uniref:Uncharacterized protein n=1 Tax=Neorhodopirellula pilleata TaxID=2714738 RepID=A0A5C6AAB5_9BACT|nr:hypothetical protein [Neorhodopirellula pilleata]TWT96499.1 hypothetical protein Pla100_29820 [Neorhodopirellula pilleata]
MLPSAHQSSTISADKTLISFLCHAVAANRAERKTLTLVTPTTIALQPQFFCDLAETWHSLRQQLSISEETRLRIDCCHSQSRDGWLRNRIEQFGIWRCRREFAKRRIEQQISLTRCLIIGRPDDHDGSIVLGITDESTKLPTWAKPAIMRLPQAAC